MKIPTYRILILIAILIHLFYYISAFGTHTLDYFFPWGNVHELQGLDFYSVPNGAYAYLHGGKLTGENLPGVSPYSFGNYNVYHPFFTLLVGFFFQLFSPKISFLLWAIIKLITTFIIVLFLVRKFRDNQNLTFALFIFLTFFPQYLEIWNGQYHYLLNLALLFLLLALMEKRNFFWGSIYYSLTLIVKPVGFLWIPSFIIHHKWKILTLSCIFFILCTLPFVISQSGLYYMTNLLDRIANPIGGPPGVFTLDAILRFLGTSLFAMRTLKLIIFLVLLLIEFKLKPSIFQSLFFWISYYLLFYDLVFEYHYTILIPLFTLGILTQSFFRKTSSKLLILTCSLPTPFFLFHFFQVGAIGHKVTDVGWLLLVLAKILPLIVLNLLLFTHLLSCGNKQIAHM